MGIVQEPGPAGDDKLVQELLDLVIELRSQARARRDFATADAIRDRLREMGIALEDTQWRSPLALAMTEDLATQLSPAVLAYVGMPSMNFLCAPCSSNKGAAPEISSIVRRWSLCELRPKPASSGILPELTEDERELIRRGRNSKAGPVPKGVDPLTYRYSTGFEVLLGYLYLCGRQERLREILAMSCR